MPRERGEPQEEGPGAALTGNDPTIDLPSAPPSAPPQQVDAVGALNALLAQYSDPPAPAQAPTAAPNSYGSVTLQQPVFRSSPEERAAATAKTDAAARKMGASANELRDLSKQKEAERNKISGDFRENSDANTRSSQDILEQDVKPLQAEQARLSEQYQKAVNERDAHQTRMQGAIEDMDQFAKRIAAEQPHEFWADQSTGMKIAAIAMSALGGANQVLQGDKTNAVTDTIANMIQRDTAMQRMRLDKNQDDYANQKTLVGQLAQHFDRSEHAQDAAYVAGMQGVIGRLNAIKPLLDSAQMRQNIDFQNAQLEMKIVDAQDRLNTNIVGTAVRANEVVAKLALDQEKMGNATDRVKIVAGQRAASEAAKSGRKGAALVVPGYEFPAGFEGAEKEATKLRDGLATTSKVTSAMQGVIKELSKADPASLLSVDAQREYKQAISLLIEAARGEGFGQTGSRLTQMLKELEESAFTPGALGRLTPNESKKLLLRAERAVWENLNANVEARGGKPVLKGAGHHPYWGDE